MCKESFLPTDVTDVPQLQKGKRRRLVFQEVDNCCQSAHSKKVRKMNALKGRGIDLGKKHIVASLHNSHVLRVLLAELLTQMLPDFEKRKVDAGLSRSRYLLSENSLRKSEVDECFEKEGIDSGKQERSQGTMESFTSKTRNISPFESPV
ncbi:hypothetical protein CDAR_174721 [Caerostris darwini]|uniref:Uncharacterized protein n=1 Tax=Caerostris darwini TaxID=1538125 RepID=A0AAV4QSC4_9ARAC|nr:hypothetical protein CDAR_174721 [Caerostris darwini]